MSKEAEIKIQAIDGKDYKVIEGDGTVFDCTNCCTFRLRDEKCMQAKCLPIERKDGRNVYFVEIKQ
ncbi:hypothetical protein [Vibrio sp. ER1A]|uniref:hypothetical protein n=1 Tax=Vibrio sp. ER1A TaxID=1517681 RepID=UPI0004DD344A|nr:hypothetical protein [Vibrio sp. ER1A]KFA99437.1 hypothetical protein HW45_03480 [Vibrio sp. ER1A]